MEYIEVTGKTIDDALTEACLKLETTSDMIEYEVIEKGSSGLFGMFTKPTKIRARKKEEKASDIEISSVKEIFTPEPVKKEKVYEAKDIKGAESKPMMSHEEIESKIRTFLNDMFAAMDMKVEIVVTFEEPEDSVNVNLIGENMGVLIGKRGQTLDSIQYLTSLVLNKGKDKYVRIKLDTENYRARRKETLESLARNIAYKVKRSRRSVSLEPMNPYERRIIHSALQNDRFVSTRSEGEEPFRHVVVYLDREKNENRYNRNN